MANITITGYTGSSSRVILPTSIDSNYVTAFAQSVFQDNTNLTYIEGKGILSIPQSAFQGCINLSNASFKNCKIVGSDAFMYCDVLTEANFPQLTELCECAFAWCSSLSTLNASKLAVIGLAALNSTNFSIISFPRCTIIRNFGCAEISALTSVSLPRCTYLGWYAFQSCPLLTSVSFPRCLLIEDGAFSSCTNLSYIYLMSTILTGLSSSTAFAGTKITSTSGKIIVPSSLVASYKAASNWSYFSNIITSQA